MKSRRMFFLVCLVLVVMSNVGEIGYGAHAQSHTDMATQPEQGGQTKLDKHDESSVLKNQKDQINYAIGVNLIGNFKKQGVDIDLNQVIKGMQDAFSGEKLLMSDDEIRKAIIQYHSQVRRMQTEIRALTAEDNKKEGEAYLAENRKKDGVITLPSGLQYRVIKPGDGKKPIDTDTVECHYRGTHINGNEFDSSYRTGRPATFKVNGVISGWTEALKLMPVGSTWQLFVPSELGYGERGASGTIGPNTTLIFEVELLAIK